MKSVNQSIQEDVTVPEEYDIRLLIQWQFNLIILEYVLKKVILWKQRMH